jgi:hypothetical protein
VDSAPAETRCDAREHGLNQTPVFGIRAGRRLRRAGDALDVNRVDGGLGLVLRHVYQDIIQDDPCRTPPGLRFARPQTLLQIR